LKSPAISQPHTSRFAQEVGKDLHLLGTVRERVPKGIKMNVDETIDCSRDGWCGWCGWRDNVHGKRTSPILAGEFNTENGPSLEPILLLLQLQVKGKPLARQ